MPEPLVCEDSDLQRLLQTVHSQPGARILYQDTVRRGGVLGFFAREIHRIAYDHGDPAELVDIPVSASTAAGRTAVVTFAAVPTVAPGTATGVPAASSFESTLRLFENNTAKPTDPIQSAAPGSALDDLLASADALESSVNTTAVSAGPRSEISALSEAAVTSGSTEAAGDDFAELLRRITAESIDPEQPDSAAPAAAAEPEADSPSRRAALASVGRLGRPDAQARLDMLLQLREIGVPVSVNPHSDTRDAYQALEGILLDLPAPAEPPRQAGAVLAIVGESTAAVRAARSLAITLRIPENSIGIAGLPAESATVLDHAYVSGPQEATRLHRELAQADTPSIVVIATDAADTNPDDPWAQEMIAALAPTACWAVVDARWKTADSHAVLARLGRVDALVVHSAELSTSPASVWDLDLPLGLLDGRSPSTVAWTGLLFRLLATDDARHRASA